MSVANGWLFSRKQLEDTPSRPLFTRVSLLCKILNSLRSTNRILHTVQEQENALRKEGINTIEKRTQPYASDSGSVLSSVISVRNTHDNYHAIHVGNRLCELRDFRFYMFHSFNDYDHNVTALGCLFLAGKVEETPKKCKDIILTAKDKFPAKFVSSNVMDEVMGIERVLLQTLKFDLHIEHPYAFLIQYAKMFKNIDNDGMSHLMTCGWTLLNASQYTTNALQWEPEVVAVAMLFLALKITGHQEDLDWEERTPGEAWWDSIVANLTGPMIEKICHAVLDIAEAQRNSENHQNG